MSDTVASLYDKWCKDALGIDPAQYANGNSGARPRAATPPLPTAAPPPPPPKREQAELEAERRAAEMAAQAERRVAEMAAQAERQAAEMAAQAERRVAEMAAQAERQAAVLLWAGAPTDLAPKFANHWYEAAEGARPVFEKAQAAEPAITKSVQSTTEAGDGAMIGLDHRLKSPESLTRKIATDMENEGLNEQEAAGRIADAVRYTSCFPPDKLVEGTLATLKQLESEGSQIFQLKNTWLDDASPYKGINVQMKTRDGQLFELQFHTPQSFEVKTKGHEIYEEMRKLPKDSPKLDALKEQRITMNQTLQTPAGIDKIQPIKPKKGA